MNEKKLYLIAFLYNKTKHVKLLNYTRMMMNKIKVSFLQNVSLKILYNKMNTQKLIRSSPEIYSGSSIYCN